MAQVISYEEYCPYGSTSYQTVRSQTETAKRYRYTGQERDEETGFGYHGARYYATWLGRWTSCDPASLVDGLNLYGYSRRNPSGYRDPEGTNSEKAIRKIEENRKALEGEKQNRSKIKQEFSSLESRRSNAQKKINKAYEELSDLSTSGRSLKSVEKETERLNKLIADNVKVHTEASTKAMDAASRLSESEQRIKRMQDKSRKLNTQLGQRANQAAEAQLKKAEDNLKPKKEGLFKRLANKFKGSGGSGTGNPPKMGKHDLMNNRNMQDLNVLVGNEKTQVETDIDTMEMWGYEMIAGLVSGPGGAFKAVLDPEGLPKASAIVMVSPHMFGARGRIGALHNFPKPPPPPGPVLEGLSRVIVMTLSPAIVGARGMLLTLTGTN